MLLAGGLMSDASLMFLSVYVAMGMRVMLTTSTSLCRYPAWLMLIFVFVFLHQSIAACTTGTAGLPVAPGSTPHRFNINAHEVDKLSLALSTLRRPLQPRLE